MPLKDGRVHLNVKCACGATVPIHSGEPGSYCPSCAIPVLTNNYLDELNEEIRNVVIAERKRIKKEIKNGELPFDDYSVASSIVVSNCSLCESPLVGTNTHLVDGLLLCSECYKTKTIKCQGCGEQHLKKVLKGGVCKSCEVSFKNCPSCGHIYDKRIYRTFEVKGKTVCNECCGKLLDARGIFLNNYSYKPTPIFFGEKEDGFHMGVELEMDNSKRSKEFMAKAFTDEVYFKTDASLLSGVEVVTHPCTLKYHMEQLPWDKLLNAAKSSGFRSHTGSSGDSNSRRPTCGLHIHVDRHAFGMTSDERDKREAKLLVLFDKFWDKIVIFSRRDPHSLENWAKRYATFDVSKEQLEGIIKKAKGISGGDRRMAVNICNGTRGGGGDQPTVEFRIFRGTLNIETVLASLQLIGLLVDATNLPTADVQSLTWEDFRDGGMEKYTEFAGYIKRLQKMKRHI